MAAPGVDLSRTGKPGPEPSRGVEQVVNIPPGMNGGDFWVFEDGCNGGVRNKLLPCLKDLAKAGKVNISGRSMGDTNVQVILEALGGGGNAAAAGGQVEGKSVEEVLEELKAAIDRYFEK